MLSKLGIRRQAKLDPADYSVLAADLAHFDLRDVAAGLDDIARYPRKEGETAFPELPRLKQAIIERKLLREADEIRQAEADERAHREAHPELYCSWKEVMDSPEAKAVMDKIAMAKAGRGKANVRSVPSQDAAEPVRATDPEAERKRQIAEDLRAKYAKQEVSA